MKIDSSELTGIFKQMLADQLAAENKYLKVADKMAKNIFTDELKSAVSPTATDIESHISRLTRTMEAVQQKKQSKPGVIDVQLLELLKESAGKGPSVEKDVRILHIFKLLFSTKVSRYDSLFRMAAALEFPEHALLLEQCSKDNQNTYAYLNQVEQNVIYGVS
jgi:ferritin-like metal-binding protein YciE